MVKTEFKVYRVCYDRRLYSSWTYIVTSLSVLCNKRWNRLYIIMCQHFIRAMCLVFLQHEQSEYKIRSRTEAVFTHICTSWWQSTWTWQVLLFFHSLCPFTITCAEQYKIIRVVIVAVSAWTWMDVKACKSKTKTTLINSNFSVLVNCVN